MSESIVFVAAKRTPFGTFGGSLKHLTATELALHATQAALSSAGIQPQEIDHVIFGNVLQTSSDAPYLARHVGLRAGVPAAVPAVTVNRLCGSGFEAICQGVRFLQTGEATTVLVGGAENMSQAPYVLRGARFGYRMNHSEMEDSLVSGLYDAFAEIAMSGTAELMASEHGISREACDAFALRSQQQAARAQKEGFLKEEIAPISLVSKKGTTVFAQDEHVRPDSTLEGLTKLKPVFKKDGVTTAGNASGINDGAAALVLTTASHALKKGWPILGKYIASHVVGVDPKRMGMGPIPAIRALLEKTKLSLKDMDRVEVNEAFAAQYLVVEKELGLDRARTNLNGGGISIGHPLAATGARLVTHLLYDLKRTGKKRGLASACIGGGQGQAVLVEL